jgi:hypothetical protein
MRYKYVMGLIVWYASRKELNFVSTKIVFTYLGKVQFTEEATKIWSYLPLSMTLHSKHQI